MNAPNLQKLRIDRGGNSSKGGGTRLGVVALILLLAYIAWNEFGAPAPGSELPEVTVARVSRVGGALPRSGVSANGYVVARTRAALSTDIPGRLVELRVEEGTRVARGEMIAKLDTRELEAGRDRAEAELRQAVASTRLAQLELERVTPLVESGDASVSDRDQAQADLEIGLARQESARATIAEIDVRIHKSSVFAPFDGIVVEKNAELGEVVSSVSSGANSRGAVVTLVDFDSLEVQIELAQTSLSAAQIGAPVRIELDAYKDRSYPGRVRQIWPTADRQKATVELRVEFLERDERILPELGVRITFVAEEEMTGTPSRVLLPANALVAGPEPAVFVFEDGTVRRRSVTVESAAEPGMVRVVDGLRGGELVIETPAEGLIDGDQVRRKEIAP